MAGNFICLHWQALRGNRSIVARRVARLTTGIGHYEWTVRRSLGDSAAWVLFQSTETALSTELRMVGDQYETEQLAIDHANQLARWIWSNG